MKRDYQQELEARVAFIAGLLASSGAKGIVFGNSGGKDSALCGILCRRATEQVLGVCMPCQSSRNFGEDLDDGRTLAGQFGIKTLVADLTAVKSELLAAIGDHAAVTDAASANIAPRLRMTTLYAIAQSLGYLVCGCSNASEYYMGYFTKWGDGAYDFNPIADLTVSEVYAFLDFLGAPASIRQKPPSAGLFEGQTDEAEMGVRYDQVDAVMAGGSSGDPEADAIIARFHGRSHHKRAPALRYGSHLK